MYTPKFWLTTGAILAGFAVAAGAFAAHGLDRHFHTVHAGKTYEKKIVDAQGEKIVSTVPLAQKLLADFKTGAEYQMYHGLALLVVGLLAPGRRSKSLNVAGFSFLAGCLGFSGGLYAYTLTNAKWIGMFVVPSGGVLFLVGWMSLAYSVSLCRGEKIV